MNDNIEYIDRVIGCRCEESVTCTSSIFRMDDDRSTGVLITTFQCTGCGKLTKVKSRITNVYDVHETLTERPCDFIENNEEDIDR